MSITLGPGTVFITTENGEHITMGEVAKMEFTTDTCDYVDDLARPIVVKAPEATFTAEITNINRVQLYKLLHRHPWLWPVSNNWLKLHGYNMRRARGLRVAIRRQLAAYMEMVYKMQEESNT